jgi:hypothetical protein
MYGIEPSALNNVTTTAILDLKCGRYRFESIGGTGTIQLTIQGRTAIFVDGNVNASDTFQLAIGPGSDAEVDWFIRGNLSVGAAKLGDPNRPSATRIYVAGSDDIVLSPSAHISANIYAPNANVNLAAPSLLGSVYGKNVNVAAGAVHYDRSILNTGNKCEQPSTCHDKCRHFCNGGMACKDETDASMTSGVCKPCAEDGDCCTPLVCEPTSHTCQPLLFR